MSIECRDLPKLIAVSDSALLVEFENQISVDISQQVVSLKSAIDAAKINGVNECVAAYRSLLIHYNCLKLSLKDLKSQINSLLNKIESTGDVSKTWRVPVLYRGDGAVDLDAVAKLHELSTDDVIKLHINSDFRVFMVGFAPGWCYLGGLNPSLASPRLDSPRLSVPKGCISIGGQQGMIGGMSMPSGWRLIGQTPIQTYAPKRKPPFFIGVGDRIQFYEVNQREFDLLQQAADRGELVAQEV